MELLLLLFGTFVALLALGVPVAFAMGISTIITILVGFPGITLDVVAIKMIDAVATWLWLAIPLFLTLGYLMNATGVTERLVDFAESVVGHITGGLSHVSVLANTIMAGVSGSSVADAAALGSILVPAMKKSGYSAGYAAGIVGTGAIIGMLIPPSVNLLIIGGIGEISILRLWLGGVVPGLILAVMLTAAGYVVSRRRNYPKMERFSFTQARRTFTASIWALVVPFIIILGMRLGIFTPTEAGAGGVVYITLIGAFVYRGLTWRGLIDACLAAARATAAIMFVIGFGSLMGWVMVMLGVGPTLNQIVMSLTTSRVAFLFAVAIVILILGCFIDVPVNTLLFFPIFLPMAESFGINPVHFGVLFGYCAMVGLYTPPVGVILYLMSGIAEIEIYELLRDGGIFVLVLFSLIPIMILLPQAILWLPNLVVGTFGT